MARTLVIGLTESGTNTTVNEDTFSLGGRVYPDMITGSEEESGQSSDYSQLYIVTQGHGGPGAGDLAGRIIQRTAMDLADQLSSYKQPDLDFHAFSLDLVKQAHERVTEEIKQKNTLSPGASLSLLLIDANQAYLLNVGKTDIFLFRDNKLMQPSLEVTESCPGDCWIIGDRTVPQVSASAFCIKHFALRPGDIVLLTSGGFNQAYSREDLSRDLASPDAFAALIRQAQIHSRSKDQREDGTVLAVKIRDLELNIPDDRLSGRDARRTIYHADEDPAVRQEEEPAGKVLPEASKEEIMAKNQKKLRRRRNLRTFLLFLLLGFLIGLAVILLIWFLILG